MTLVLAEFSAPWSRSVRVAPTTSHPTAMAASTAARHQHRLLTERCRHRTPGAVPCEEAAHLVSRGITVDDDTVRTAMRIAFEEFKIVLEPSGAIALAAASPQILWLPWGIHPNRAMGRLSERRTELGGHALQG